jgi:hypothetical protein
LFDMDETQDELPHPEVLAAALIFLMTHYARTGCPRLAACVLRHLELLALHGEADPVLRDTCASLRCAWEQASTAISAAAQLTRH